MCFSLPEVSQLLNCVLAAATGQLFFAYRLKVLSHSWILTLVVIFVSNFSTYSLLMNNNTTGPQISVFSLAVGMVTGALVYSAKTLEAVVVERSLAATIIVRGLCSPSGFREI